MVGLKTILCPVDFFPASARGFAYAVKLASKYGCRVHALHVVSRILPAVSGKPVRKSPVIVEEEDQARRELERLRGRAAKSNVPVEIEIKVGDVDLQILRAVKETGAGLMVMGTHGRRRLERWILGSVAERMMRHSPIPLLTIGAAGQGSASTPAIRRILVTTDFSKGTADAVEYALSVSRKYQAAITILHVLDDPSAAIGWKPSPSMVDGIREKIAALVPAEDRRRVTARVEIGKPFTAILRVIKSLRPGLVVMNTHGLGMIDRVLIGSTTERVVRGIGGICPVLLVPPPGSQRK